LTFAGQQNSNSDNPSVTMPQQPKTPNDYALEWAQVLVPGAASIYSMNKQAEVSMNANDNNKDISIHRNRTMLGFGRLQAGQTPPVLAEPITATNTDEDGVETNVLLYPEQ